MREFRFSLRQTFPIFFTYLFIGIAFGMMMSESGYAPWWSLIMAVFIFAGSMQIVMVPLLTAGTPLPVLALMTLFINGRHLFYGLGFIERFRKMGWRYPYMVLTLTDETYSILCSVRYEEGLDQQRADFLIALINQCYWIFGCTLGAFLGSYLNVSAEGIDFSATAFFLVVVVNQWTQARSRLPALCGFVSALVFLLVLGPDRFLIPALSVATLVLVLLRDRIRREERSA